MDKINWRNHLLSKILIEEYQIMISTQHDTLHFKISYVKHNGYTRIEQSIGLPPVALSQDGKDFQEWLKFRSDLNTRYDQPHWWGRIRFNRKKKLVIWAVNNLARAYSIWYQENIKKLIDN